jgi:hypothetical protein
MFIVAETAIASPSPLERAAIRREAAGSPTEGAPSADPAPTSTNTNVPTTSAASLLDSLEAEDKYFLRGRKSSLKIFRGRNDVGELGRDKRNDIYTLKLYTEVI